MTAPLLRALALSGFTLSGLTVSGLSLGGCSQAECDEILLTDAQNYAYSGSVDLPSVTTASGVSVEVCWDELTSDIQCHDMSPEDVDNVSLIRFTHLTQEEVESGINDDDLRQSDISGYVDVQPEEGATCVELGDMSFFGTEIDITEEYVEGAGTYLLNFTEGTEPGVGAYTLTFLEPSSDSDVEHVDVGDGCGVLEFDASLGELESIPICADGPWVLDWSGLTRDGTGNENDYADVDRVTLGYYADYTPEELEARFLDLELITTRAWELTLESGSTADLSEAVDTDGQPFTGFDASGTWVLALRCSTCYNPAPLFLTLLEPQGV